jgi:hypothetical protein
LLIHYLLLNKKNFLALSLVTCSMYVVKDERDIEKLFHLRPPRRAGGGEGVVRSKLLHLLKRIQEIQMFILALSLVLRTVVKDKSSRRRKSTIEASLNFGRG